MIERHPREVCQLCGASLYYAEQWQSLCRACADAHGITRLCDGPARSRRDFDWYRDRIPTRTDETVGEMLDRERRGGPMCRCTIEGVLLVGFYGIDRSTRPPLFSGLDSQHDDD